MTTKATKNLVVRQAPAQYGSLTARVVSRGEAGTTISADFTDLIRPERTLPVECGRAALRLGSPELQFGQLDPFNEKRLTRVVIVRYDKAHFVDHVARNEEFRSTLELNLTKLAYRGSPGYFCTLFSEAKLLDNGPVALVDAEFEAASYSGGKAAIVFISYMNYDIHQVTTGHRNEFTLSPDLEITMPSPVLADVLNSWKELAGSL